MASEQPLDLIRRSALIAEYDRVHIGPPGGARKLMEDAPAVDAVVLPCKIGDAAWGIRWYRGVLKPQRGIVSNMFFVDDMKLCIVVEHICRGEWGKKVFATYEDACAAIREIDGGNEDA